MPDDDNKARISKWELFRTFTTFISSVMIAGVGLYATRQYNSSQLEISRNKELTALIPKLGESDAKVRQFSAIALALYGNHAIPALLPTLSDVDPEVRMAGVQSLSLIGGDEVIGALTQAYKDRRNNINLRCTALYTLGFMRAPKTYDLAVSALENPRENPDVRKDAVTALGFLGERRATGKLLSALRKSVDRDVYLTSNVFFALGQIEDSAIADSLIRLGLLDHPEENIRYQTVLALMNVGNERMTIDNETLVNILARVETHDESEKVRQAARDASGWIKRKG